MDFETLGSGDLANNSAASGDMSNLGSNFSSFLTGLAGAANTGNTLYNQITGKNPAQQAQANTLAASNVSAQLIKFLPWIIGGGVVLVLGFVFLGRRK